jgi:hypothetical protein
MARTAVTPVTLAKYPALPITVNSIDVAFSTGSTTDGFSYQASGRELVLVTNVNASPQTVTIKSVADSLGRTGDLGAYSLSQNEYCAFIVPLDGFVQSDGTVNVDVGHNDVHVAVIRLPSVI